MELMLTSVHRLVVGCLRVKAQARACAVHRTVAQSWCITEPSTVVVRKSAIAHDPEAVPVNLNFSLRRRNGPKFCVYFVLALSQV
jgi:hypothetical protein